MYKDAIMVLGLRFEDDIVTDRNDIGRMLRNRVIKGIDLYREGVSPTLLFSGGYPYRTGKYNEAQMMRRYAENCGIHSDRIFTEEISLHTVGNFYFTKRDVLPKKTESIVVVTSDFHTARTQVIANHILGPTVDVEVVGAQTGLSVDDIGAKLGREQKYIAQFLEDFGDTAPGDDSSIAQVIREKFPAYRHLL